MSFIEHKKCLSSNTTVAELTKCPDFASGRSLLRLCVPSAGNSIQLTNHGSATAFDPHPTRKILKALQIACVAAWFRSPRLLISNIIGDGAGAPNHGMAKDFFKKTKDP